jgi:hypothetical protein
MSCQSVRKVLAVYSDHCLPRGEEAEVEAHLARCPDCNVRYEQLLQVRETLRAMPKLRTPNQLATQLQVLASRERVRQMNHSTWRLLWHEWAGRARLVVDNAMRPMALPVAGGLVSALFLFSMLVPPLQSFRGPLNDTPTGFYTEPTIATTSPFGVTDEVMVELVINEEGRIVDYSVRDRQLSRELISQIGNMILFTSFNPATAFGQPTPGRMLVSFRRSHIVVKG